MVWINPYTRDDGVRVKGHARQPATAEEYIKEADEDFDVEDYLDEKEDYEEYQREKEKEDFDVNKYLRQRSRRRY